MVAPTDPHVLIADAEARQRAAKSVAVVIIVVAGTLGAFGLPAFAQSSPWSTRIQQIPVGAFILMMSRDPVTGEEDRLLVTTPLEPGIVIRVTPPTLPQRTEVFGLRGLSEGLPSLPCYRP